MTNEYAIKVLAELRGYGDKFANIGFDRKEALDLAIKALEQQVCDNDCEHCDWVTCPKMEEENETITVSKGCLKARKGRFVVYDVEYLKSHIEQEAAIYGNVSAITGKTEDRPTGRWIDIQYFKNDDTYYRPKCPFCSIEPKEYSNFCPNCGARMTESEDKE